MVRKTLLSATLLQNSLAVALREVGRIERTFILSRGEDPALRRRVTVALDNGEVRARSCENQRHRGSGLSLVTAAIALWNTVSLVRAAESLGKAEAFDTDLLQHVSPLGWEHRSLTGDYTWHSNKRLTKGGFRPLRMPRTPAPVS